MKAEVSLTDMLEQLNTPERIGSVRGIRRGIEREGLRITPEGRLAQSDHPRVLGAALTHPNITTDYAESLMEFITPASAITVSPGSRMISTVCAEAPRIS